MDRILICDDDRDIVNALKLYLANPEYELVEAHNGLEALEIVRTQELHLILLDIMMPGMDGIGAMAKIRQFSNVPIILLTAKSEDADKILGLSTGADDYVTKPFSPTELAARVNSQLRRYRRLGSSLQQENVYRVGGIALDVGSKTVTVDENAVSLTPKEFEILRLLIANPGKVFAPRDIYRYVWHETPLHGSDNIVAVHICHLREKLELNPNEPRFVKLVFGQGYKIEKEREQ